MDMQIIPLQRYTTYLRWHARVTLISAGLYALPALVTPSLQMTLLMVVCSVSSLLAVLSWWMNRHGRGGLSLWLLYIQLLMLPLAFALIFPVMYPVVAYVPVLVVAITLSLLGQRIIIWTMLACGTSTILTVLAGVMPPFFSTPPVTGGILPLVIAGSYAMVSGLTYTLLWHFKGQKEEEIQQRTAELDTANRLLHEQAIRDPLTNLFNRRYIDETLEIEIQRAQRSGLPIGVVVIDLDHFKQVNDTYGHAGGDVLLQAVAVVLQHHVRSGDLVSRYGGEEFLMVLPGIPLSPLYERATAIRAAVRHMRVSHAGQDLGPRTCSIGVAVYPDHGLDGRRVIQAADAALYQAKAAGRDQVVVATAVTPVLDVSVIEGMHQ